jgi:hypothetical protein
MLSFVVIASFSVSQISGWGGDGHAIITELASSLMSPRSARLMGNFLGDDLIGPSRWADTDEALTSYPGSASYHFSHTPYRDCKPFDMKRDCRNGSCIVTGLADAINTSIDPAVSREERVDALKFVLHLMADIHQPLHTGFREDAGGTLIALNQPANLSLHEVWDYGLINRATNDWRTIVADVSKSLRSNNGIFIQRIRNQTTDLVELLSNNTNGTIVPKIVQYLSTLASDTVLTSTCSVAYKHETGKFIGIVGGDYLSDEYFRTRVPMMKIQFAKAAVRLALLIDAISIVYEERLLIMREEAREARITARLFVHLQEEARALAEIHGPLKENYFGVLSIDFDTEAYIYKGVDEYSEVDSTNSGSRKISKSSAKQKKLARKLQAENKLKRDEKRRVARMVDGVDLTSLVLIRRDGRLIITDEESVVQQAYRPLSSILVHVKFANQNEADAAIPVFLDCRIFVRMPTVEFLTRVFRAIKGEADIVEADATGSVALPNTLGSRVVTDMKVSIGPSQEIDPITRAIFAKYLPGAEEEVFADALAGEGFDADAYYSSFKSTQERLDYETRIDKQNMLKLSKLKDDLLILGFPGHTVVTKLSVCRDSKNTYFELNRFRAMTSKGPITQEYTLWIDRRVFDTQLGPEVAAILQKAFASQSIKQRLAKLQRTNNSLISKMDRFFKLYGRTAADQDLIELIYYKTFDIVDHPENPLISTLVIDLTIDPSHASLAHRLAKMARDR